MADEAEDQVEEPKSQITDVDEKVSKKGDSTLTLKPTIARKISLIATEESRNYDQLVYWEYCVTEEQDDAPSNVAIVLMVHSIADELTEETKNFYDIKYITGCQRRVLKLVPENFLSSRMPVPMPFEEGQEVLTQTLKTYWKNHKNGERSNTKPSYFSNNKARCYDDNALFCLRDGYKDEPPLGWNVNLTINAEKKYFTKPRNAFRKLMVDITSNAGFEAIILTLILLNTVALAMVDMNPEFVDPVTYQPYTSAAEGCCPLEHPSRSGEYNETMQACKMCPSVNMVAGHVELFFTVAFTVEMVLKILAMGFIGGRGTYLASPWNILDFVVVITGLLDVTNLIEGGVGFLRLFRLLRPLRTFSAIPPMKNMISTIFNAMAALVYVMTLLLFVIVLFGIIMSELFRGELNSRCRFGNLPLQIPTLSLVEATELGWNESLICLDAQLLSHIYKFHNCSENATELYWHRLYDENAVDNEKIAYFDTVDDWYYTHAALLANSSAPVNYNDHTLNPYVVWALQYVEWIKNPPSWGAAFSLPNDGYCSDAENVTLPVSFEQCVMICYDIGLQPEYTCTNTDGTRCDYIVGSNNSLTMSDFSNCAGTPHCEKFQQRTWDLYDPTNPMCEKYCPRQTTDGSLAAQFPNDKNWDENSFEVKENSPWSTDTNVGIGSFDTNADNNCIWTEDEEDTRYCGGFHTCGSSTYCGSNHDSIGQPRFSSKKINEASSYIEDLYWGYPIFDTLPWAMLSIFQSLTLEGWVDILYTVADGFNFIAAAILFVAIILFGAFLIMNLTLAVIWMAYDREKQNTIESNQEKKRLRARAALEAVLFNLYMGYRSINNLPKNWPLLTLDKIDNLHDRLQLLWQTMEKAIEPQNPCDARALMNVIQNVLKSDVNENGETEAASVRLDPSYPIIRKAILVHNHLLKNRGRYANLLVGDAVKLKFPDTKKIVKDAAGSEWPVGVDIEKDEVGKIKQIMPEDHLHADKVAVKFKKGIWLFDPGMLKKDMDFGESVALDDDDEPLEHVGIQFLRKYKNMIFDETHEALVRAFDEDAKEYDDQRRAEKKAQEGTCSMRTRKWCCHGLSFWCCGKKTALEVNASPSFVSFHNCITGPIFEAFIVFVIIANTVVLMMDMYPVGYEETFGTDDGTITYDEYATILEMLNFVFSCIFLVELILKNAALGFRDYFRDGFNIFDALIVFLSIIELFVAPPSFLSIDVEFDVALGGAWSALRAFRLFRLFKLARSWKKLRMLLAVVARTLGEVSWFLVLLSLFIFIFGLLGVSLFANKMRFDNLGYKIELSNNESFFSVEAEDSIPRSNFDDLGNAMIVVYQVLSGENWNTVMYDAIRADGVAAGAIYFIVVVILGVMIVLELFVAILLGGFGDENDDPPPPQLMRLLTKDEDGDVTEVKFAYHIAACSSNKMWSDAAHVVARERPEAEWEGKLVVVNGYDEVDPEIRKSIAYNRKNMNLIVDDCIKMWTKICDFAMHAKDARAVGVVYIGNDNDPFTVNQLETIDNDIHMPDLSIPIVFPTEFVDREDDEDDDFEETLLRQLHTPDVTVINQLKTKGCCVRKNEHNDGDNAMDDSEPQSRGCCSKKEHTSAKVAPVGVKSSEIQEYPIKENKVEYFKITEDNGCIPRGRSLFVFKHDMPCRIVFFNMIKHPAFDQLILLIIIAGSFLLAWETPLWDPDSTKSIVVGYINVVFNGIFIAELVAKVIALGFVLHPGSYLRDAWNVLDFIIVVVSIILMASDGDENDDLKGLRSLRVLRALRPLRTINRAPQLKLVINALLASIWPIFQTLMMISIFFIIFATLAVTYFQGNLYYCDIENAYNWELAQIQYDMILCNNNNDTTVPLCTQWLDLTPKQQQEWAVLLPDKHYAAYQNYLDVQSGQSINLTDYAAGIIANYGTNANYYNNLNISDFVTATNDGTFTNYLQGPVTSRMLCQWMGFDWVLLVPQSFDNVFPSLASLYELSTTEGWIDVMWAAADGRGVDMEPIRDVTKYGVIFFIGFIMIGTFFAMNLFIGIICDTFAEKRSENDGTSLFVTEEQKQWQAIQKIILKLKPFLKKREPKDPCRRCCFSVADSDWFEHFIMALIILNTLVLCVGFYGQTYEYEFALDIINYVLFGIFALEAAIKLIGFGGQYFSTSRGGGRDCARYVDAWNVFDFSIVIGTAIGILLSSVLTVDIQAIAGIIRTFRLLRIVRLLRGVRGLKVLLNTIVVALPAVVNIFVLLLLFLIIFAIMGIQLFATIAHGEALNDHANFQDFFVALLTLLRGSTGENWNGIMHDMSEQTENCVELSSMQFNESMCGYCDFASDINWEGDSCVDCIPLNGCGDAIMAKIFWYVFTLFITFMLLNVCIAVILEAWENAETTEGSEIKEEAMVAYCNEWQKYDPDGQQYIPLTELPMLLQELSSPLGFLEPPATIVETHGTAGQEDEHFILEKDDGSIVSVIENGVPLPRKVLRSELRFPHSSGEQLDVTKAMLMKRMRVRYTKSTAQAQAEVFRMQLKSQTTKEGLHVVSFLPTAVACAHRSFAQLSINEDLLGRVQEQVGDKMAGHTDIEFHPAKILAVMLIVRQARCLLFRENLLKKLREQQGRPSSMPSTPVRSQQDTDNSKKSERGNDINNV